jgi:hypothetical protein
VSPSSNGRRGGRGKPETEVVVEPGVVRVVASDGLTPVVAAASKGRVRGSCCLGAGAARELRL